VDTEPVDLVGEKEGKRFLLGTLAFADVALAELDASYRRALGAVEGSLGPDHHELRNLRRHLGDVGDARQRLAAKTENAPQDAELLLRRALITFEAILGPESAEVAVVSHELAQILAAGGRGDEARWLYERALGIRRQVLGPSHPEVATTLHNLALFHEAEGRVTESAALWAEARAMLDNGLSDQSEQSESLLHGSELSRGARATPPDPVRSDVR
jgi:hypothetical protein